MPGTEKGKIKIKKKSKHSYYLVFFLFQISLRPENTSRISFSSFKKWFKSPILNTGQISRLYSPIEEGGHWPPPAQSPTTNLNSIYHIHMKRGWISKPSAGSDMEYKIV